MTIGGGEDGGMKAGVGREAWIPAYAGMTGFGIGALGGRIAAGDC